MGSIKLAEHFRQTKHFPKKTLYRGVLGFGQGSDRRITEDRSARWHDSSDEDSFIFRLERSPKQKASSEEMDRSAGHEWRVVGPIGVAVRSRSDGATGGGDRPTVG